MKNISMDSFFFSILLWYSLMKSITVHIIAQILMTYFSNAFDIYDNYIKHIMF